MRVLLDFIYIILAVLLLPKVIYRIIRHKRYRTGWSQRFGKIKRKYPEKKCIWIHAVSVGEVNATKTLISELENRFSDYEIIISTTTDTGFARANKLFGEKFTVFYFPLDLSLLIRRAFDNIRPSVCLLMELEVWPNFTQAAHRRNIPVVVVNGRISDKGFSAYKKIKPFARGMFKKLSLILAQTDEYANRFIEIGIPAQNIVVTGSLKYETAQTEGAIEGAEELGEQLELSRGRLWVAGGTGKNEEELIIEVYKKLKQDERFCDLRLAIVPRKPERFDEVARLIEQKELPLIRYSKLKDGTARPVIEKQAVILGDTMGDLRKFYNLATVIFVGRSLVPMGGSDMMEAAAIGKPTIFGPHTFNFRQTVEALIRGNGAIRVKDTKQLLETLQRCLTEESFAKKIAQNGRRVIIKNQGATKKSVEHIEKLLAQL